MEQYKKHNRQYLSNTVRQELLLRACLLPGQAAVDAWQEWQSITDIDHLEVGSRHLLPLLYSNLRTLGIKGNRINTLKGFYRITWYKNQMLFRNMAAVLKILHNAGIKIMVLKGAILTLIYYKNYGLRPMQDFDILVCTDQAPAAVDALQKFGWNPKPEPLKISSDEFFSVRHAYHFENVSGDELDLHWHLLYQSMEKCADDDFWNGAISSEFGDVPIFVLNPADQLLHICVHGTIWDPMPPLRWVADAMMILKTSLSEIDWDRLLVQTQKHQLALPINETLNYLHKLLDAPIPVTVLENLQRLPVSNQERMEYKALTYPDYLRGPFKTFYLHYFRYARTKKNTGLLNRLNGFPKYFQILWGLDHIWQVPLHIVSTGFQRIWRIMVLFIKRPVLKTFS